MIEQDILKALQNAAIAAVATTDAGFDIAAVGITLDPQPADYWQFVHIPNNRMGDYWGNERTYQGLFRVLLHRQIHQLGPYVDMRLIGMIADFFPKETRLNYGAANVQIYDVPDAGSLIIAKAELIYPLTLRYRCFRP